jgi:hypothetical protein
MITLHSKNRKMIYNCIVLVSFKCTNITMFEIEVKLSYVPLRAVHAPRFQIFIVLWQCDGN